MCSTNQSGPLGFAGCTLCLSRQVMENCQVVPCWEGVLQQSGTWQQRRAAADEFNKKVGLLVAVAVRNHSKEVGTLSLTTASHCHWGQECTKPMT